MRWHNVLTALRDWTESDPAFAPLITVDGKVQVGIGYPGAPKAKSVWYRRGRQGERDIPLNILPECLPGVLMLDVELWAQIPAVAQMTEEAKLLAMYQAMSDFEDAWLACVLRFFAPTRPLRSILGGYYAATISQAIPLASEAPGGQVGSLYTIALNSKE